jgi:RimJ/RimL family protein N-acetyltransferase
MAAFIAQLVEKERVEHKSIELEIECDPRNTGSWKLAERLGFSKHSLTERAWESKGEWVDSLVYRKTM